jgi:hypothetical protein
MSEQYQVMRTEPNQDAKDPTRGQQGHWAEQRIGSAAIDLPHCLRRALNVCLPRYTVSMVKE